MTKTQITLMYALFARGLERMEELIEDHRHQGDGDTLQLLKDWVEELNDYAKAFPEIADECNLVIASGEELIEREISEQERQL